MPYGRIGGVDLRYCYCARGSPWGRCWACLSRAESVIDCKRVEGGAAAGWHVCAAHLQMERAHPLNERRKPLFQRLPSRPPLLFFLPRAAQHPPPIVNEVNGGEPLDEPPESEQKRAGSRRRGSRSSLVPGAGGAGFARPGRLPLEEASGGARRGWEGRRWGVTAGRSECKRAGSRR